MANESADKLKRLILDKVEEIEKILSYIESHKNSFEGKMAMIRWAIIADEATALLWQAKEHWPPEEIDIFSAEVNIQHDGLWTQLENNPRRFKQMNRGKEMFDA